MRVKMQEAVVIPPNVAFAVRGNPGNWQYVTVNSSDLLVEPLSNTQYLKLKELLFDENWCLHILTSFFFNKYFHFLDIRD